MFPGVKLAALAIPAIAKIVRPRATIRTATLRFVFMNSPGARTIRFQERDTASGQTTLPSARSSTHTRTRVDELKNEGFEGCREGTNKLSRTQHKRCPQSRH